jgi:hypothetical protein
MTNDETRWDRFKDMMFYEGLAALIITGALIGGLLGLVWVITLLMGA